MARTKTTVRLTVDEADEALSKTVAYRAPGAYISPEREREKHVLWPYGRPTGRTAAWRSRWCSDSVRTRTGSVSPREAVMRLRIAAVRHARCP